MVDMINSIDVGLCRYATIPAPSAAAFHRLEPQPVCAMVGICEVLGLLFTALATSIPEMRGGRHPSGSNRASQKPPFLPPPSVCRFDGLVTTDPVGRATIIARKSRPSSTTKILLAI
jgi:hypothetical protein